MAGFVVVFQVANTFVILTARVRRDMSHTFSPCPVDDITTSTMTQPTWVTQENPNLYDQSQWAYISSHPKRHVLGIVGGNEVSLVNGNIQDVESDLTWRTRPLSKCPEFKHTFVGDVENQKSIHRKNRKYDITMDVTKNNLPANQMWAYPAITGPAPLAQDPCVYPHKY